MVCHINSIKDFNSLLNYYISCLEKEERMALSFNSKLEGKSFYSNIFKKEEFFTQKKEQVTIKKTPEIEKIFNNYKTFQNNAPIFYGYPLFMDSNGEISPIFFVEIFFQETKDSITLTKESVIPEFNHYILTQHNYNLEEINKVKSEIEEEENFSLKLQKITNLFNFKNELHSKFNKDSFILKSHPQLINKAILYFSKRTGFTKGLIDELQKIKKLPLTKLKNTALSSFFNEYHYNSNNIKDILEIFQLNESQEKAVKKAFSDKLTVITGPPGTGKSQVVLNIIANAVWNDKTVLFASKNNRAVDVVNDKLKNILPTDLVIRMGSRKHRQKAQIQIEKILQNKSIFKCDPDWKNNFNQINKINNEIYNLKNQLKIITYTNQKIHENQKLRDDLAKELSFEIYDLCLNENLDEIDKIQLEFDIKNNFYEFGFLKKILRLILKMYYQKKEQKLFLYYFYRLSKKLKKHLNKKILKLNTNEITNSLNTILSFKKINLLQKEINDLKSKLIKMDSVINIQNHISGLQKKRINLHRKIFKTYWLNKIKNIPTDKEICATRYIDVSKKLETYIEDYGLWKELTNIQKNEIKEILPLFPIWIVTNLSVKNSLPLEENLFDLLIIDEASQCDISSALPLLYRAKQAIIIGDPMQLKHISLLKENEDKRINAKYIPELYVDYAHSQNSLYEIAERINKSQKLSPILLNEHYRSHKNIINFSNKYFYEKKLKIMTDEKNLIPHSIYPNGIEWIDVKGKISQTKSPFNKIEALKVIEVLKKMPNLKNYSLGIVTLFRAQMELIGSLINCDEKLKNMDITIGTTHKFQGDEKDIIIFSPAIAENMKSNTLNWILTTTQLLNVAITRARSTLIIVGDKKKCLNSHGFLKELAEYTLPQKEIKFDSPLEAKLYERLIQERIKVIPQYEIKINKTKPYRLDFALFINDKKYDIEIDGEMSHFYKIESDILRDIHLRNEGWQIRRFKACEIEKDIDNVIKNIKRLY